MPAALILAVGQDPMVQASRVSVLRSAGYCVEAVDAGPEAIERFQNGNFDLVLLCHSVSLSERERLTRAIRASGSCTRVLLVSPISDLFSMVERVVDSHPQEMLKGIETALREAAVHHLAKNGRVSGDGEAAHPRPIILCIDDDNEALQLRRMVLERNGYDVVASSSSRNGLRIFAIGVADAVLIEYAMPEIDGAAAAIAMRSLRSKVPLILYSAHPNVPEDVISLFDRFIIKGTSPHLLIAALDEFLAPTNGRKASPDNMAEVTSIDSGHRKVR
jgi:CheY-like chemotaxis protein